MAASDVVGTVYKSTASFGRDVFHYIVTGTVFVLICGVPLWPPLQELCTSMCTSMQSAIGSARVQIAMLFAAVVVLFCIGHVLLSVGFVIRNMIWMKLCCEHVRLYEEALKEVKRCNSSHSIMAECRDAHILPEMTVFVQQREIHSSFIERYGTLWHFRLGLAASFLLAGVVNWSPPPALRPAPGRWAGGLPWDASRSCLACCSCVSIW